MYKDVQPLFIKTANGRYEHKGYGTPDLLPGVWLINKLDNTSASTSCTNIGTRLAKIPGAADLELMVKCVCLKDIICQALHEAFTTSDGHVNISDLSDSVTDTLYKELAKQQESIDTFVDNL